MHAAGGATFAVDAVMSGRCANAFVATRPPGPPCGTRDADGLLLFQQRRDRRAPRPGRAWLERVAIVDILDVHHGNGTQDIFWDDPSVLYASTHEMPLYPGTGALGERGEH